MSKRLQVFLAERKRVTFLLFYKHRKDQQKSLEARPSVAWAGKGKYWNNEMMKKRY